MNTRIKFKPIATVAKEHIKDTKLHYFLDLRDAVVNRIKIRVRLAGGSGVIQYADEFDYNGEFIVLNTEQLIGGRTYQISGQAGFSSGGVTEWGEWSDWENFRVELLPEIKDNLTKVGNTYVIKNQAFHAHFDYMQRDNDVLNKYKIDLYTADNFRLVQEGKWQFSSGYPTKGGLIEVKTIPSPFKITYQYSNATKVEINVWPRTKPWETTAAVAFDIGQSLAEFSDLGFEILQEDNIAAIKIKSKRKVVNVKLSSTAPQVETTDLVMEDFKQLFYDLEIGVNYFYLVEMESIRGLRSRFRSHTFAMNYNTGQSPITANISATNVGNGTVVVEMKKVEYYANPQVKPPHTIIFCRRKVGNVQSHCFSTNTAEIRFIDEVVEIARFQLLEPTPGFIGIWQYSDFFATDYTIEEGATYEYFGMFMDANLKLQIDHPVAEVSVPSFEATYICDNEYRFRIMLDQELGTITQKVSSGYLEPLENKFPVASYGQLYYKTGRIRGRIVSGNQILHSYPVENGREYQFKDFFLAWIHNKKDKVLQLQNGKTMRIHIIDNGMLESEPYFLDFVSFGWNESGELDTESLQELFPTNYWDINTEKTQNVYLIQAG